MQQVKKHTTQITWKTNVYIRKYDYITEGIVGKWMAFGLKLKVKQPVQNGKQLIQKLRCSGFAAENDLHDDFIKLLPNEKLCHIFTRRA